MNNSIENGMFDIGLGINAKVSTNNISGSHENIVVFADNRIDVAIMDNELEYEHNGIFVYYNYPSTILIKENELTTQPFNGAYSSSIGLDATSLLTIFTDTKIEDNTITILDNTFDQHCDGIRLSGGAGTIINDNIIKYLDNKTLINEGIGLVTTNESQVEFNQIFGKNNTQGIGVRCVSSEGSNIGCNDINSMGTGTLFYSNNPGTSLLINKYSSNTTGVNLWSGSTFIGVQKLKANSWISGTSDDISSSSGIPDDKNRFICHTNTGDYWPDPVSNNDLREYQQAVVPSFCGVVINPKFPTDPPMSPYPGEGFEWSYNYYRYRYLDMHPELIISDTMALNFYQANVNNSIGEVYEQEKALKDVFIMSILNEVLFDSLTLERDNAIDSLLILDTTWTEDTSGAQALTIQYLQNKLAVINEDIRVLLSDIDSTNIVEANTILANLNILVLTDTPALNYQSILRMVIERFVTDSTEWTNLQKTDLTSIANQCPSEGGRAVHFARQMLDPTLVYDDESICLSSEPLNSNSIVTSNNVYLYPNPTTGLIEISWESDISPNYIEILDLNGKQVESIHTFENHVELNLESFKNGIYLVKIMADNLVLKYSKIVVTK